MADSEPLTYKITVSVKRSDLPETVADFVFSGIPVDKAEAPNYAFALVIELFRLSVPHEFQVAP